MTYSSQLQYVISRISGFTTNHFKLMPNGSDTATANQIVRIALPQNSLVNLKSFALHFDAEITSAVGVGRLPPGIGIGSLIERVEVSVGGLQIAAGSNFYNVLAMAKQAVMGDYCDPVLGHSEVIRNKSYVKSGAVADYENKGSYVVNKFEGFLGSVSPSIVDLGLLPEMVISITLAGNNVCIDATDDELDFTKGATSAAPVYTLTNIYATVECMGMSDGTYEAMVAQQMSQVGYVELPFKNYLSFQDNTQSNVKFSVASQSISRIWIVHRADNFADPSGAIGITGYLPPAGNDVSGVSQNDFLNTLDYNKEKYTSNYLNFPTVGANVKHWLTINGAMVPQWQASECDMIEITKNSVLGHKNQMRHGFLTQTDNYSVYCVRLNLPESEHANSITGLDSRGTNCQMFYNMANLGVPKNVNIFVECDSSLRIGAAQQAEVLA